MWRLLRDGAIGTVHTVFVEAHGGRIERWPPNPGPLFDAGPMAELAVDPLRLITAMLGQVCRVQAVSQILRPHRTLLHGTSLPMSAPDLVVALLGLRTGAVVRLTTSFELAPRGENPASVELHGDDGSLRLADWQLFDAMVEVAPPEGPFSLVSPVRLRSPTATPGCPRCLRARTRAARFVGHGGP